MFLWDPNTQMAESSPAKPHIIAKTFIIIITITTTIIALVLTTRIHIFTIIV